MYSFLRIELLHLLPSFCFSLVGVRGGYAVSEALFISNRSQPFSSSSFNLHSSGYSFEKASSLFLRLVLYVLTVVHLSASSKYISVVLCVFLMPVIMFFQKPPIFTFREKHPRFCSKKPRSASVLFAIFPTAWLLSGTASFATLTIAESPYSLGVHRKWAI